MKWIKRLVVFAALAGLYFVIKEMLMLYWLAKEIHELLGYALLVVLGGLSTYFLVVPLIKIFSFRYYPKPATDAKTVNKTLKRRLRILADNEDFVMTVQGKEFESDEELYFEGQKGLSKKVEEVRRKYIGPVYATTSISPNAFIDSFAVMSATWYMVREIMAIYLGRPNMREFWRVSKMILVNMSIAGAVEAAEESFIELLRKGISKVMALAGAVTKTYVPGSQQLMDEVTGAASGGLVNAILLTRISLILENYYTQLYLEPGKKLSPKRNTILQTTISIIGSVSDRLKIPIPKFAKKKKEQEDFL